MYENERNNKTKWLTNIPILMISNFIDVKYLFLFLSKSEVSTGNILNPLPLVFCWGTANLLALLRVGFFECFMVFQVRYDT